MDSFAFISHPLNESEFADSFFAAKLIPNFLLSKIIKIWPPHKLSEITGVASKFNRASGWIISCPLTSEMITSNRPEVVKKVAASGKLAKKLGAKILGLGRQLSFSGDLADALAKNLTIPVTTGNSYRVAAIIEGIKIAATARGYDLDNANIVVIGGASTVGGICAGILAREVRNMTLVDNDEIKMERLVGQILYDTGLVIRTSNDAGMSLKKADIVIVANAGHFNVNACDFKPGAVVYDVFGLGNVLVKAAGERNDVVVIEKIFIEVPGDIKFDKDFGCPLGAIDSGMVETIILALEKNYNYFTASTQITVRQVDDMKKLAKRHGFRVTSFLTKVRQERIKNDLSGKIIISGKSIVRS